MSHLSLKRTIWIGFGLILSILAIIATVSLSSHNMVRQTIGDVIEEAQPAQVLALGLDKLLNQSTNALLLYVISHNPTQKQELEVMLMHSEGHARALKQIAINGGFDESLHIIEDIEGDIQEYKEAIEEIIEYTENNLANYPARAFATNKLLPLNQHIQTNIQELIRHAGHVSASGHGKKGKQLMALQHEFFEMRHLWSGIILNVQAFLNQRSEESLSNVRLYQEQLLKLLLKLERQKKLFNFEQSAAFEELKASLDTYMLRLEEFRKLVEAKNWRQDMALVSSKLTPLIEDMNHELEELLEFHADLAYETSGNAASTLGSQRWIILTLTLGGIGLGLATAYLFVQFVIRRINGAVFAMTDIAEGEGNLSHRLDEEGDDEMAKLAHSFNIFINKIQGVINLVIESSTTLAREAHQMSETTESTKVEVVKQQRELATIVTALGELSENINEVANSASEASDTTRHALEVSQHGTTVTREAIDSIKTLADEVNTTTDVVNAVAEHSTQIESIVSVINDIAEQTNLLALNAAIEAARAGDHGRGFSVVADEVRDLAQRTQGQTEQIRNMIKALQTQTGNATAAMERSQQTVEQSVDLTQQAWQAINTITEAISHIAQMSERIASATEHQNQTARGIRKSSDTVSDIAEHTSQSALATSRSSHEVSLMAAQLRGLVEQFLTNNVAQDLQAMTDAQEQQSSDDIELF